VQYLRPLSHQNSASPQKAVVSKKKDLFT